MRKIIYTSLFNIVTVSILGIYSWTNAEIIGGVKSIFALWIISGLLYLYLLFLMIHSIRKEENVKLAVVLFVLLSLPNLPLLTFGIALIIGVGACTAPPGCMLFI